MKKGAVIVLIILAAAGAVFADNAMPQAMKDGPADKIPQTVKAIMMSPMGGQGPMEQCGPNGAPMDHKPDFKPITQEQAKARFAEFMDKYMKGFMITDINTVYMPFGAFHQAAVADKAGNKFYLDLMPDGQVRGPMLIRQ